MAKKKNKTDKQAGTRRGPSLMSESIHYTTLDVPMITRDDLIGDAREAGLALYKKAVELVAQTRNARNTFLRHKLKISRERATAIIERMTNEGILGPYKGSNIPREILIKEPPKKEAKK